MGIYEDSGVVVVEKLRDLIGRKPKEKEKKIEEGGNQKKEDGPVRHIKEEEGGKEIYGLNYRCLATIRRTD